MPDISSKTQPKKTSRRSKTQPQAQETCLLLLEYRRKVIS